MRLRKLAMVLGVGLLLVGAAAAQQQPRQPGGGFGGFGGGFGGGLTALIGTSKPLQDELKMDKEQADKVTAALAKVREEMRDETAKLRDRNTTAEQRTEITKKLAEANSKALETVLKPEQLKRFRQIENQQAGMGIYTKDEVRTSLKLNDDQKEKIDTITKDLTKDLRDLAGGPGGAGGAGRGRPDPDAQKKRESLTNEAKENIAKLLTAEQKETLKGLTGEPFDLPRGGFGGVGGPGGGGFGGFGGFGGGTPGTVLSNGTQTQLKLTDEQKKELEALQKEVDSKLEKLLNEEQRTQLKQMRENAGRGAGGAGGAGGRPGGTGGRPGGAGGNRPARPNNPQ